MLPFFMHADGFISDEVVLRKYEGCERQIWHDFMSDEIDKVIEDERTNLIFKGVSKAEYEVCLASMVEFSGWDWVFDREVPEMPDPFDWDKILRQIPPQRRQQRHLWIDGICIDTPTNSGELRRQIRLMQHLFTSARSVWPDWYPKPGFGITLQPPLGLANHGTPERQSGAIMRTSRSRITFNVDFETEAVLRPIPSTMDTVRMQECHEALVSAIHLSANFFQALACSISCLINARRAVNVAELKRAVEFGLEDRKKKAGKLGVAEGSPISPLNSLFSVDGTGHVHFTHPAMANFLRSRRISGIDTSHRTLARACLAQLRLNLEALVGDEGRSDTEADFAAYARENGQYHWQEARKQSIAIDGYLVEDEKSM